MQWFDRWNDSNHFWNAWNQCNKSVLSLSLRRGLRIKLSWFTQTPYWFCIDSQWRDFSWKIDSHYSRWKISDFGVSRSRSRSSEWKKRDSAASYLGHTCGPSIVRRRLLRELFFIHVNVWCIFHTRMRRVCYSCPFLKVRMIDNPTRCTVFRV